MGFCAASLEMGRVQTCYMDGPCFISLKSVLLDIFYFPVFHCDAVLEEESSISVHRYDFSLGNNCRSGTAIFFFSFF